jgi:pyruvate ferredoxin oxidoreductase delta subunit
MQTLKAGKLVEPGSTEVTKTGAWRTFVPKVEQKKCIKCCLCEIYCPEGCIHQVHTGDVETLTRLGYTPEQQKALPKDEVVFVPDLNYCKGCGICANECPRKAITMALEEK